MDLWNASPDHQRRAAMAKFACIGVVDVRFSGIFSGLYRPVSILTADGRWVSEMLYDTDLRLARVAA